MNRNVLLIGGPGDGRRAQLSPGQHRLTVVSMPRVAAGFHPQQSHLVTTSCERHDYETFFGAGGWEIMCPTGMRPDDAFRLLVERYPPEMAR